MPRGGRARELGCQDCQLSLASRAFHSVAPSPGCHRGVNPRSSVGRRRGGACGPRLPCDVRYVDRVSHCVGAPQNLDARGAKFSAYRPRRTPKGEGPAQIILKIREWTTRSSELTTRVTRARDSFGAACASATRLVSHRRSRRPNLARIFRLTREFASDRSGTLVCRFAH